jgi:hypothetical protein|tara:strand:+ start:1250 stop:1420 length:171 start_codon:yes stop_codon:yes gene_type:complete
VPALPLQHGNLVNAMNCETDVIDQHVSAASAHSIIARHVQEMAIFGDLPDRNGPAA